MNLIGYKIYNLGSLKERFGKQINYKHLTYNMDFRYIIEL